MSAPARSAQVREREGSSIVRAPRPNPPLLRAFNARHLDAALEGVHPDVDWPNAIDGGRLRGHEEVREYWTRQFETTDARVKPQAFSETSRAGSSSTYTRSSATRRAA